MRENLNEAFRAALEDFTEKTIFLIRVPPDPGDLPHAVLETVPGGAETYGAWAAPEECRDYLFNIKSIGIDPRQCAWMADKIEDAVVGREPNGEFQMPIVFDGGVVNWRLGGERGAILPSGEQLWQAVDTYRLRIERQ